MATDAVATVVPEYMNVSISVNNLVGPGFFSIQIDLVDPRVAQRFARPGSLESLVEKMHPKVARQRLRMPSLRSQHRQHLLICV